MDNRISVKVRRNIMTFIALTLAGEKITFRKAESREQVLQMLADGGVSEQWLFSLEEVKEQ